MTRILMTVSTLLLLVSVTAKAAPATFDITIENHRFHPDIITVPAGEKVKLKIINKDPTPEEFESYELNREKIVPGNSKIVIFIGPLEAGEYKFFGEFNEATAKGKIIVK